MERRTSLKLEAIVCEYNHLLADHMVRQRSRVNEQLARLEKVPLVSIEITVFLICKCLSFDWTDSCTATCRSATHADQIAK
jgi:hypothetical protein